MSDSSSAAPRPRRTPSRRRRIVSRILAGLVALVLVALVGGYWYARPLLLTGTGYAAHNACAVVYVAGRDDPEADLPPNPLVPHLRTSVTSDPVGATSTIRGLLARQDATFVAELGCTVGPPPERAMGPTPTYAVNPLLDAPSPTPDPEVEAALARAFGDDLSAADKAALGTRGIVVLRDGKIIGERYADGFTADTPQLGWSMTKSVANLLTGVAVQRGAVRVDETGLFPQWSDARAEISVDDLMRMTSGLTWDETYDLGTPITRMLYLEPDMAAYVASLPGESAPGTVQEYSSGSTNLLCSVLQERLGAQGTADFPRQLLFAPLGLRTATLETDSAGLPVCSSYLWATPREWASIGQFALDGGTWDGKQLLPQEWMRQSLTPTSAQSTDDPAMAASWRANQLADGSLEEPTLPADAFWAQGHDGQRLVVAPSAGLVVVRLGFTPDADDLRVHELVAALAAMPANR